jgi:hypothetical protein
VIRPVANRRRGPDAESVTQRLITVLRLRRRHDIGHSRVRAAIAELVDTVVDHLGTKRRNAVRITVRGDELVHDGRTLGLHENAFGQLANRLTELGCGGLVFRADVSAASITALLDWLRGQRAQPAAGTCAGMEFLGLSPQEGSRAASAPFGLAELDTGFRIAEAVLATLQQVEAELREGHELDANEIRQLATWIADQVPKAGIRIAAPVFLGPPEDSHIGHASHVILLALALLQAFARSREELEDYCMAAVTHDVGLWHLDREALESPTGGRDVPAFRLHPEHGADCILGSPMLPSLAIETAFCHHMEDGEESYPTVARELRPGPVADAIHVADRVERLTRRGPGRNAVLFGAAMARLRDEPGMASKLDVIEAYLTELTPTPPGTLVRVRGGSVGVVLEARPDHPDRPRIALVQDPVGDTLPSPVVVDLRENEDEANLISEALLRPPRPLRS